jgi:hypothetical protein
MAGAAVEEAPPPFDARADYLATCDTFARTFDQQPDALVDTGEGQRVLAGRCVALTSYGAVEGAEAMEVTVVEMTQGAIPGPAARQDPNASRLYRMDVTQYDAAGDSMGAPYIVFFRRDAPEHEFSSHTEYEGQRVRGVLSSTRYDQLEAQMAASTAIHTSRTNAAANAEYTSETVANHATRRVRVARWLGFMGWANPLKSWIPVLTERPIDPPAGPSDSA